MSEMLRKIIRELIEEELDLDETTSSGAAGPYNTPYAFRGNAPAGKKKAEKNSTVATGYELVDDVQDKADDAGPQNNEPVLFGKKGVSGLTTPKNDKDKVIQEAASDAIKKQQEKIRNLKSERDEKKREATGIDAAGKIAVSYRKKIEKAEKRLATLKAASKKNESKQYKNDKDKVIQEYGDQGELDLYPDDIDRTGTKCNSCGKGTYKETGQLDDMNGVLHCNKCGAQVKRHGPPVCGDKVPCSKKSKSKKTESVVTESKYDEFKMAEGSPRKKIGEAIREISRQISEVDRTLRMSERLKTEEGGLGGQLWKSTAKALTKLEGRMNVMSTRIRNLKA